MTDTKQYEEALVSQDIDGWQDISTAPKDGTRFVGLVWQRYKDKKGEWVPNKMYWENAMSGPKFIFNGWRESKQPSLWMHLPAALENE